MTSHRQGILSAIRAALPRAVLPPGEAAPAPLPLPPEATQDPAMLVDRFGQELAALTGHVHQPATAEAAIEVVLGIVQAHRAQEIIAWDEAYLPLPGLTSALDAAGIARRPVDLPRLGGGRKSVLAALAQAPLGLTGAAAGIASNGSLALVSGPGRSRLASLLPPVHVALLSRDRIYPTLAAFLQAQPEAATAGSNLVFIAGPSRTADIEMTLSIGVHGPGEIHVVLL
ncbi:MAG: lactate utilization protein C [Anaerolineae bacterium]